MPTCVVGCDRTAVTMATQFALKGLVTGIVSVDAQAIGEIAAGRLAFADEPAIAARIAAAQAQAALVVTAEFDYAISQARTIVVYERIRIGADGRADYGRFDETIGRVGRALTPGSLVLVEGVLAVGDMRGRVLPALEAASGKTAGRDFLLAYATQRTGAGHILADTMRSPKIVAGLDLASRDAAGAFLARVMDTFMVATEALEDAELVTLVETASRYVQGGFATELAAIAARHGVDIRRVIAMANSQPYSWSPHPGLDSGGDEARLATVLLRDRHDSQLSRAALDIQETALVEVVRTAAAMIGGLTGRRIGILGGPGGVAAAGTSAAKIGEAFRKEGATVGGIDDLAVFTADERRAVDVLVVLGDRLGFDDLELSSWSRLELLVDARNSFSKRRIEAAGVRYLGVGVG